MGSGRRKEGRELQRISSINGRYKTDRGRVRIVEEMEKTKNVYAQLVDMN